MTTLFALLDRWPYRVALSSLRKYYEGRPTCLFMTRSWAEPESIIHFLTWRWPLITEPGQAGFMSFSKEKTTNRTKSRRRHDRWSLLRIVHLFRYRFTANEARYTGSVRRNVPRVFKQSPAGTGEEINFILSFLKTCACSSMSSSNSSL